MNIILDEESIHFWTTKIFSYEGDHKTTHFKELLLLVEESIIKYCCPGSNKFLSIIYSNIWEEFTNYLKAKHNSLFQKFISCKLFDNASIYYQALLNNQKRDNPDQWLLTFTVTHYPLSSSIQNIEKIIEVANELLDCHISEILWIQNLIRNNKKFRISISHFLADINIYNLGNQVEF